MRIPSILASVFALPLLTGCGGESAASVENIKVPKGLESVKFNVPADNAFTAEKVGLGKMLFFDKRLSSNGEMSCESCHQHAHGWTDGKRFSTKVDGKQNTRNSPTLYNVGYQKTWYWDGRAKTLEGNVEAAWKGHMGGNPDEMAKTLGAIGGYSDAFKQAFGDSGATGPNAVKALASFVRSLRSGDSAYDRGKLKSKAKRGEAIYMQRCITCHTQPLFTDAGNGLYHNTGVGEKPDQGRGAHEEGKDGAFKTPTLRSVTKTAPYFHDGSAATLEEAVTIMAHGGVENPNIDPLLAPNRTFPKLTDKQVGEVVEFLKMLESTEKFTAPTLPK